MWQNSPSEMERGQVVVHICNPSYSRGRGRKMINSRSSQEKLVRPYLKNKIQTKGLGYDSSGRVLA
jgi:hypothetical protein